MTKLVLVALVSMLLSTPFSADAWQVMVRNPTDRRITVQLWHGLPLVGPPPLEEVIKPHSTGGFVTSVGNCPRALTSNSPYVMDTDMYGTWYYGGGAVWAAVACADFKMKICEMPKGYKQDYSFCKD